MELGIVSDEISPEFRDAVEHGLAWGIRKYELRTLSSGRVPSVKEEDIEQVLDAINSDGIEIPTLSPGLFKLPVSHRDEVSRQLETVLPDTIKMAEQFGARNVIVFGFQKEGAGSEEDVEEVIRLLGEAGRIASRSDITLLVENEPGYWCDSGKNTAEILRRVSSPAVRSNWDPCNAFGIDESPFPEGYAAIKEFVRNVHVKDTRKGALVECVPVGEGLIDWRGQLTALVEENRVDHVTIETHSLPLIDKSKQNVDTLLGMLATIERG